VPILEVLQIVSQTVGNVIMEKAIKDSMVDIERGESISVALGKHPIFPSIVIRMITAGEQTGKIDNMLERIQKERSSGSEFLDFKTGMGGIIEGEFLVQALQMRFGVSETNYDNALSSLERRKIMTGDDANLATQSYGFLRKIETGLRRFENKNISTLPTAENERAKLAKRLGYDDMTLFVKDYEGARKTIHALYESYVKSKIG
jgi:glutamine synthetase adenylyltransferase